jgi:outer membrane receptor protein involved in Fe transport
VPVGGLERAEVLRDGAAALYGSDAVAGVVNNALSTNYTGLSMDATYGRAEGTGMREFQLNGKYGSDFAGGRGNISLMANFTRRTSLTVGDQDYTATNDLRSLVEGTAFEGNTAFDTRSTSSSWGGHSGRKMAPRCVATAPWLPVTQASFTSSRNLTAVARFTFPLRLESVSTMASSLGPPTEISGPTIALHSQTYASQQQTYARL